jgi:hypothetical protein
MTSWNRLRFPGNIPPRSSAAPQPRRLHGTKLDFLRGLDDRLDQNRIEKPAITKLDFLRGLDDRLDQNRIEKPAITKLDFLRGLDDRFDQNRIERPASASP